MKISRLKIVGLGLACHALAVLCWPAPAYAQLTAPREGAQIEFGPVSLYPSLQIVDAGRDQNVFNDGREAKDDYTFTVASRGLVVTRLGLNELMFSSGSDYVWFRKYKSERSSNATYALRFNLSASRFKPFIGAERTRTRTRPSTEIDVRARRLERNATAGTNFNLTERTAITASASVSDSSYEEGEVFRDVDLSKALNRTGRLYSGGIRYAVTALTTLVMVGAYGEDIFPKSHIRDAKTYAFAPTLEFNTDAAIRGTLSAGMEVFKPADPELATYKGAVFSAGLNWSMFGRTTFDLRASRNISYSYKDTEPYYLLTGVRLNVSQRFIGPLELQATVDRQYLSYRWRRGVDPQATVTDSESGTTDTLGGGVGIMLRRGFKLVLLGEQTKRRSSVDSTLDFNKLRFLSTVTIGS